MALAAGTEEYVLSISPVEVRGASFVDGDLDRALAGPVGAILWDDAGRLTLEAMLTGVATTGFEQERLREVLGTEPPVEDWRVGEAFAEAYLVEHRVCEFPWPMGRDLRNPSASPAGTDLVGLQHRPDGSRFAFGEVKTSQQARWPPDVVTGRHGLVHQLESLRDRPQVTGHLVKYLGHHAGATPWRDRYRAAAQRYFRDPGEVSLFGVLVRDVEPRKEDLARRGAALANGGPPGMSIELHAFYFPPGSIAGLPARARAARSRNP